MSSRRTSCATSAGRPVASPGPDDGAAFLLRNLAARQRVRVVMPGLLTGAEKSAAFVDSDIFCLPSPMETQSVALLEAASYGMPIVCPQESAPSQFVSAEACLFAPPDAAAISAAFARLADSADMRRELGMRAAQVVKEHFSANRLVKDVLGLYDEVVREPGSQRGHNW